MIRYILLTIILISCSLAPKRTGDEGFRELISKDEMLIGACMRHYFFKQDKNYRERFARDFNLLVPEAFMQWKFISEQKNQYNFNKIDELYDYARKNDMLVRGHSLVWYYFLPAYIKRLQERHPALVYQALEKYIFKTMGYFDKKYGDIIYDWVVVNEAVGDDAKPRPIVFNKIGDTPYDYVYQSFRWAHQISPKAKLMYNDYITSTKKADAIYELVKMMVDKNVPVHRVGLQFHTTVEKPFKTDYMREYIHRLEKLGVEVHITEMDVAIKGRPTPAKYKKQAEIYKDALRLCLKSKSCKSFVMWGFTDRYSWLPEKNLAPNHGYAHPYDKDYNKKPAWHSIFNTLNEW